MGITSRPIFEIHIIIITRPIFEAQGLLLLLLLLLLLIQLLKYYYYYYY